jgi:hypothetical protein
MMLLSGFFDDQGAMLWFGLLAASCSVGLMCPGILLLRLIQKSRLAAKLRSQSSTRPWQWMAATAFLATTFWVSVTLDRSTFLETSAGMATIAVTIGLLAGMVTTLVLGRICVPGTVNEPHGDDSVR